MLLLQRRDGETVHIGENIVVTVQAIQGKRVTLGFEAPREVVILRGELSPGEAVAPLLRAPAEHDGTFWPAADATPWVIHHGIPLYLHAERTIDPIPMILHCPSCGMQHIDAPELVDDGSVMGVWDNPPHRSHLCHGCGTIWRPADVPTVGVEAIQTRGKADKIIHAERARVTDGMVLLDREGKALHWLIELAAASWNLADNTEDNGKSLTVAAADFERMSKALEALEALPDDKPGWTLGPAGKASWALRRVFAAEAPIALPSQPEDAA